MKQGQVVTVIPSFETEQRGLQMLHGRKGEVYLVERKNIVIRLLEKPFEDILVTLKRNSLSEI